jgi:hypothetical protein
MRYKILGDRVKIIDSYLIPKAKYSRELSSIRALHPTCRLWHRSEGSIKREWATHTLAYSLHIRRDKTADCDLNYELRWYHNLAYAVVGTIALLVIK